MLMLGQYGVSYTAHNYSIVKHCKLACVLFEYISIHEATSNGIATYAERVPFFSPWLNPETLNACSA